MNIRIGQEASFTKTITESDVYGFAGIVGDFNGVHVNQMKAENSVFENRIAHGMLVASFISTVLGMKLPGDGTIYLEQNLKFKRPVYFGETITASCQIIEIINEAKGIYKLCTIIRNQKGEIAIEGYAIVMYKGDQL